MKRRTLDKVISSIGVTLAATLVVAGALLAWGHTFISGQVHDQLAAQKIFFPEANSESIKAPEFAPLRQYAGQQLTTGAQAEAYANYYIGNHLKEIGGGKTYSQLSAESMADPDNTELAGTVQTMFKGETLRGLLLNAYAFGTIGRIAGIASIAAFAAAALLFLLSALGFVHSRRAEETVTVVKPVRVAEPAV
jgi:hypothetical protein